MARIANRSEGKVQPIRPVDDARASGPFAPTSEEIAQEAYNRYAERGFEDGHDVEDWLAAEDELLQRRADRL